LLPKEDKKWAFVKPNENQRLNPDKTGYRIGVAPIEEVANKMKEIAQLATDYVSKNKVKDRQNLDVKEMENHVSLLRGAVMIAYPAYHGLPPWDAALLILEEKMNFIAQWPDCEVSEGPKRSGSKQAKSRPGFREESSTSGRPSPNRSREPRTTRARW
jgi:hypothetical protein